ncbi:hypothetical protein AB0L59_37440 [Streptomyces sp. NPDC052109]|uniref:hypothetical protein n=1 Tax=Streptomyces sp. NPDC052109 TaxID=3155527 RepID=UPI00343428F1
MGRRGDPRSGVKLLVLGLALPALLWTTACGRSGGPVHSARPSPSPSTTSDAELCYHLVAHWSREVLDGTTYGDYQSMGLSTGQYEILRDIVDAARTVKRRQGEAAAAELIDRQTRRACTDRYRHGAPTEGSWT